MQLIKNITKTILSVAIFLGGFFICQDAFAACTGSSPNLTAASANYADVKACTDIATYGDTVNIPACAIGNCVWDTPISLTKDIRIVGAGKDATVLTNGMTSSGGAYIGFFKFGNVFQGDSPDATSRSNLSSSGTHTFEVTGIHFYSSTNYPAYHYAIWVNNSNTPVIKRIRIHDNKFTNLDRAFWVYGYVHGLFDSNTLVNTGGAFTQGLGSGHWTNDVRHIGTAEAVYIENNSFTFSTFGNNNRVTADNNHGPSVVVRYNTITGTGTGFDWEVHCPTSQFTEVYGNSFASAASQAPQLRSGIGIIFFNKEESDGFVVRHEYSEVEEWEMYPNDPPPALTCPYPTAYNPYTGTSPQICNDSIDPGSDCVCSKINHTYFWNNRKGSGTIVPPIKTTDAWNTDKDQNNTGVGDITKPELVEDREYFNYSASFNGTTGMGCGTASQMNAITPTLVNAGFWVTTQNNCGSLSSDNIGANPTTPISGTLYRWDGDSWESYYTPYTYPHPLRGETPAATVTTISGCTLSGGSIK